MLEGARLEKIRKMSKNFRRILVGQLTNTKEVRASEHSRPQDTRTARSKWVILESQMLFAMKLRIFQRKFGTMIKDNQFQALSQKQAPIVCKK